MIRKNLRYQMDLKSANDTLQSVLKTCDKEPNTIPFDRLVFNNNVNAAYTKVCRYLSLTLLLFVILSPLTFRDTGFSVRNSGLIEKIIVTDHALYEDHFILHLSGSSIDYQDIYARKNDGNYVFPSSVSEEEGEVVFPYEGSSLNIYVPDLNGKVLHAILTANE